jgi:hypothetical protein
VTSTFVPLAPRSRFASVAWQTFEEEGDVDHPSPRPRCAVEASRFISVTVDRFILKQHHGTFNETRVKPVKRLEAMQSPDVDDVEVNRPRMIPAARYAPPAGSLPLHESTGSRILETIASC